MSLITHCFSNLAVMISVHEFEGLLVLGFLPGEFLPGEAPVLVLVVLGEERVHLGPGQLCRAQSVC